MKEISTEQKLNRWDVLPDLLKEALSSEENSRLVLETIRKEHVPEEKFPVVALIIGDIIFGFKHPEDLAKELEANLGIHKDLAVNIAVQIDRKIFLPVKGDLERVYNPIAAEKVIGEQQKVGVAISDTIDLRITGNIVEEKGEEIKPEETGKEIEKPILSESEQPISQEAKIESAATFNLKEDEEAPAIIHKEEEIKPISKIKSSLGGLFGIGRRIMKEEQKSEPKSVIAKVEMGIPKEAKKEFEEMEIARTEQPKFKIVHYSDFKTPLDNLGGEIVQPNFDVKPKEEIIPPSEHERILESVITEPEKDQTPAVKKVEPEKVIIKDYTTESTMEDQQEKAEDTVVLKKPEIPIPKEINLEEVKLENIPVREDMIDLREMSK